jgi:hypothetical protein
MPAPANHHLVRLIACLLTAIASGDDFCLARLALPLTSPGEHVLPLDDPNTDFAETTDSVSAHGVDSLWQHGPAGHYPATTSSMLVNGCPPRWAAVALQHLHITDLNTPLRC